MNKHLENENQNKFLFCFCLTNSDLSYYLYHNTVLKLSAFHCYPDHLNQSFGILNSTAHQILQLLCCLDDKFLSLLISRLFFRASWRSQGTWAWPWSFRTFSFSQANPSCRWIGSSWNTNFKPFLLLRAHRSLENQSTALPIKVNNNRLTGNEVPFYDSFRSTDISKAALYFLETPVITNH